MSTAGAAATSVQYNFNTRYDKSRFRGIPDGHSSKSEPDVMSFYDNYLNEIDKLCQRVVDCISAEGLENAGGRGNRKRRAA